MSFVKCYAMPMILKLYNAPIGSVIMFTEGIASSLNWVLKFTVFSARKCYIFGLTHKF